MCDLVLIFLWRLPYGHSIGCALSMNNALLLIYHDFSSPGMINFSCNTWEKYIYVCVYEKVTQIKYCIISWVSSVSFAWCRHVRKISQLSLIKRGNSLPRYVMSRCSSNSEEVQDDKEINIPVIRCICIHLHILTLYPLNATFWRWNGIFSFHLKKLVKTIKKTHYW